ncbi:30S ribosomal protein S3ae [Methanopyrus kandleri]|uniref:Small ribosomal subunit protein eS1 n=2 Tax=Methanopyrus kandleri TaxID=2320 RepID=RS3A_METKA|nr:30S ribosomal protein S3ae [Methanopyrus kandleri]Q8TVD1.1 RecName: Full=Small ribosomal subunit protein eS1; AltName: Full=30S ribosomal protein S3Ae; AltName: Full=Ribosomal protein S1e [Methanopyrus kandleri AV19]AAM02674.1 Ribosomal protein S3AE [Methanopyrus kandleri AV19]HII70930.1 30S ribosomal protein S3ae [Methanopyrus kandleri]
MVRDKWKDKVWYTILAPDMFDNVEVGETPADDPEKVIGRVLETTLGDVLDDITKHHIKVFFRIYDVEGTTAYSKFEGHRLMRDYVRSLVRRGTSRIDGVIDVVTKDGYKVRVAGLAFTTRRAKTSQQRAIRKEMFKVIEENAKECDFDEFIRRCLSISEEESIPEQIKEAGRKIYPIRQAEIRKTEVLEEPNGLPPYEAVGDRATPELASY